MLEIRRRRFFSKGYIAEENGVVVAELSQSAWRARGEMMIDGKSFVIKKQGALKETFTLWDGDLPLVEVRQIGAFRSTFEFNSGGGSYRMRRKAWYSSSYLVERNSMVVGSVRPRGLFASGVIVELPTQLPLAARVFIGWIALVRQEAAAAAAVAGA